MASKPQYIYWDLRAFGEPVRYLLKYLEVDFEDKRIAFGETGPNIAEPWFKQKYSHGLDFPNLPFYVDGDVKITQSTAILQHIARKYNLDGDTLKEKAIIDMIMQTDRDLKWQVWLVYQDPNHHQILDDWRKTIPTQQLGEICKFLEGKKYILGDKISYADFSLFETLLWYRDFSPDVFKQSEELANVNNFMKRIEALPQIKAHMESETFKNSPYFMNLVHIGFSKDPNYKPMPYDVRNYWAKYELYK